VNILRTKNVNVMKYMTGLMVTL